MTLEEVYTLQVPVLQMSMETVWSTECSAGVTEGLVLTHCSISEPYVGGSVKGFNWSQFVMAMGSWMYLFYKGNTGQGHRRRLLPLACDV